MTVNVVVITEQSYTVEIDEPEGMEDEIFQELSCEPCMDDIMDVESFLDDKGLDYSMAAGESDSRIEMWR